VESIEKPLTGLAAQEDALEKAMQENTDSKRKETQMRQQENVQYQKNVALLVKTKELLTKAMGILEAFYASLDEKSGVKAAAFPQQDADPTPPKTWEGAYTGQGEDVKGNEGVLGMLKLILDDTEKQIKQAHEDENEAQADYEDSMSKLSKERLEQESGMIKLKNSLAKADQDMINKKQDLKQAWKDKNATIEYLASIKPGCDFILENYEVRTKNRGLERRPWRMPKVF
jgi:hypothetical protein